MAQNAPPDDPARYSVLKKLAAVRSAAGDYADANGYLEMAIRRTEANLGQEDPKIAADLLESVALWRSMKDYGQALAVLSRAMAIHMKPAPFKSAVVADDFSRFAQIQMEYQKSDDAAGSLQTAISIRTHLVGPLDPSLIYDLDRQGTVYITLRQYDRAEEAYRHALVIRESVYGKDNADLISTGGRLGLCVLRAEEIRCGRTDLSAAFSAEDQVGGQRRAPRSGHDPGQNRDLLRGAEKVRSGHGSR